MVAPLNPPGETPSAGVPVSLASRLTVAEQYEWVHGFLRARPVSRRAALRGAAGALAGLGLYTAGACGPTPAGPAPPPRLTGRRLSFGADPTTQMAVAAELTAPPAGPVLLDLGTGPEYGQVIEAEIRHLVSAVPQRDGGIRAAEQFFAHALTQRLAPDTVYHYRVRLPGGPADWVSPDATFRTAPAGGARAPFSFTAFADHGVSTGAPPFSDAAYRSDDTQRAAAPAASLVDLVVRRAPAFHLLAGDICYAEPGGGGRPVRNFAPDNPPSGFDNFDPTVWTAYFAQIEASAAHAPWMFATGNHDMEAVYDDNRSPGGATHGYGGHLARLALPGNGPRACPSVYVFRYGNVGVLSLDANDLSTEIRTNAGYSAGAQTAWVRDTLRTLRADPSIEFVVAFFHHCAFATSQAHGSDGGVRDALAPLFDEFHVDLVVQGHNHQYERTNPIRAGRSGTQAPDGSVVHPLTDGTTYVCVGSGGRPRYRWPAGVTDRYRGLAGADSGTVVASYRNSAGGDEVPETVDWSQTRYLGYALLQVDVVPGPLGGQSRMTVRAVTDLGREIDAVTLVRAVATG